MEESSFFNDVDGDRVYYAEDFAEYFIPFFTMVFLIMVAKY